MTACASSGDAQFARETGSVGAASARDSRSTLRRRCDPRAYTWAIGSLGRSRRWEDAVVLLDDMVHVGLEPNVITFNALLTAAERGHQWEAGLALLSETRCRSLRPDVITYNTTISACERSGEWSLCVWLLDEMHSVQIPPNVISYSAAISGCGRSREWARSLALLRAAHDRHVQLDIIAYNATITASERGWQWPLALQLLDEASRRARLRPTATTFGAAISACGSAAEWRGALALLRDMPVWRVVPNLILMSTAVVACRRKRGDLSLQLVQEMISLQLEPDAVICSSSIRACGDRWEQAFALFEDAIQSSVAPDIVACNALLTACYEAGHWEQAVTVLDEVRRRDLSPTSVTHTLLLRSLAGGAQWARAAALLRHCLSDDGCESTPEALTHRAAVAQACHDASEWQRALELLGRIQEDAPREAAALATVACALHWEGALSLLEMALRARSPAVGWELYCGVALVLLEAGLDAGALRLYREALEAGYTKPQHAVEANVLDLHGHSAALAKLAVRAELLERLCATCQPKSARGAHGDLVVVTGRGNNSMAGEAVLLPEVLGMLREDLGLPAHVIQRGRVRVSAEALRDFAGQGR